MAGLFILGKARCLTGDLVMTSWLLTCLYCSRPDSPSSGPGRDVVLGGIPKPGIPV